MPKPTPDALKPVVIAHRGRTHYQAAITPGFGSNLVSFRADGTELIHYDEALLLKEGKFTGAFNMFPTPCRLANCAYTFEDRRIEQKKRGEPVFIHGLVRDEAFDFEASPSAITSRIAIDPGSPLYEGFPFTCTFRLIHTLSDAGLTVTYQVVNRDTRRIPFGYGIHPYWRLHGPRDGVCLRIPCDQTLESKDLVPTGRTQPVAGTPFDFRTLKPLGSLVPDHVFWKRHAPDTAELALGALGRKIVIAASVEFVHMIVYTTETAPFVCVENLTTSPNGQNLAAGGDNSVANLLAVEPGQTAEGWIRYAVQKI